MMMVKALRNWRIAILNFTSANRTVSLKLWLRTLSIRSRAKRLNLSNQMKREVQTVATMTKNICLKNKIKCNKSVKSISYSRW